MRRSFLSVLVLASLIVGVESCKKGDTGPAGPQGPTGADGAQGAAGAQGAQGVKGADGTVIRTGAGLPAAASGAVNDFYLDTNTSILYGPKTASGWPATGTSLKGSKGADGATGSVGATGATGAAGATGAQGPTGPTGATGANGTNFLAGNGAPAANKGANGDYYFDIISSTLYGPKTGGAWPMPGVAIGVTATPRSFFLDITLDGKVKYGNTVNTFADTSLEIDTYYKVFSDYQMQQYDVTQIVGVSGYGKKWFDANAREILFIDEALEADQLYMVPTQARDFRNAAGQGNVVGRRFIYTRDPANQPYIDAIRKNGMVQTAAPRYGYNFITDPYWHFFRTPGADPQPPFFFYPHLWASPSTVAEFSGLGTNGAVFSGIWSNTSAYNPGADAPAQNATANAPGAPSYTAAGGLRYGKAAPLYEATNWLPLPSPAHVFTMSQELYDFLMSDISNRTSNKLCLWMYAEAFSLSQPKDTVTTQDTHEVKVGYYVNFYPAWKKKCPAPPKPFNDYTLQKQINLNTGMIRYGTADWVPLANTASNPNNTVNLSSLGAAWTHTRDSGSVDFSFTYPAPVGYQPTAASIKSITLGASTGNNVDNIINAVNNTGSGNYATPYRQAPIYGPNFSSYIDQWKNTIATNFVNRPTPVPGPVTAATTTMAVQTFYNSWISLNNAGAFNLATDGTGYGYGSGPINDYGNNASDGGAYDVTPPAYTFDHWTHLNGKQLYKNYSPSYGWVTVQAPNISTQYPWGGIVVRNGVIYVNYYIANGGSPIRSTTQFYKDPRFIRYYGDCESTDQKELKDLNPADPEREWTNFFMLNSDFYGAKSQINTRCGKTICDYLYSYGFLIPKGYRGSATNLWDWNDNSYTQGPWPANQNMTCQGQYYEGFFIPEATELKDHTLIRFKIQTQPSNSYPGIRAGGK